VIDVSSLNSYANGYGAGTGWATAVNNNGWVGGDCDATCDFHQKGWVYDSSGTLHNSDIQTLMNSVSSGYTFCAVWGITDATNPQILVWGRDSSSIMESFLLTPTPEPSTVILLATGLAGLVAYAWRKRK